MTITDEEIEKAVAYLRDSSSSAAQARANRLYLEAHLKVTRAEEMTKSEGTTVADRENAALTSDAYLVALDGYRAAVEADEKAKFLREAADAKIRAWQTQCSNERATRI